MFDYLIVGAGFSGSVLAERLATQSGKRILMIDKRSHIGGNAFDKYNEDGILIHPYGPHIFHTNAERIFAYLSKFTEWRAYEHRVLGQVDGKLLPIPINLDTVNKLYNLNMTSEQLELWFRAKAERVENVRNSEDIVVSKVGRELYEKFVRGYTRKQWELDPSELDASVLARIPTRIDRDDRYFTDAFQSMPLHGYTRMFEKMIAHPNIKVMLNTDYKEIMSMIPFKEMIFTGPVDEFFDYKFGKLPYRSLEFKHETIDKEEVLPVGVVNYPDENVPYTRITEFKKLTGQQHAKSSIVYEFPRSTGDPYYPIPKQDCTALYNKYKELAEQTKGVHFVGRLATYKYYNMDQVVGQALATYDKISGKREEKADANKPLSERLHLPERIVVPSRVPLSAEPVYATKNGGVSTPGGIATSVNTMNNGSTLSATAKATEA